jgi:shikimate kinase
MNVFLIGMMGSGKSTLGRALARATGKVCVDLDEYLVEREGASIPEIFSNHGESYFREKETFYLKALAAKQNIIIATGGGAPCFGDNLEFMNQNGVTVFLDVPEDELFKRLHSQKNGRPLLEQKTDEELAIFISSVLGKRRFYYEKAMYKLKGNNISVNELLQLLK